VKHFQTKESFLVINLFYGFFYIRFYSFPNSVSKLVVTCPKICTSKNLIDEAKETILGAEQSDTLEMSPKLP